MIKNKTDVVSVLRLDREETETTENKTHIIEAYDNTVHIPYRCPPTVRIMLFSLRM